VSFPSIADAQMITRRIEAVTLLHVARVGSAQKRARLFAQLKSGS
jgi:hypothetical protein